MGIMVILCLLVSDAAEVMMVQHPTLERAREQSTRVLLRRGLLWKRLVLASVMLPVSTVSGFFSFSDDKAEPGDCRSFPISQCAFC